ncbi:G-protein coupled receptor GRL101-like [Ptychodera flava]|uniref:G-protein coupled receptor GRL101-like n=1 Tax=Ptychodera flava TaxID=63121 RepID=UPI00396A818A
MGDNLDSDQKGKNESTKANIRDLAKRFALRTSSHGISRIAEANPRFRRAAWIIVVVASFIGYSGHVDILVSRFLRYDVSIKMDVITGDSVLFPAVTVCNSNKLRLSEVKKSPYSDLATVNEPHFSFTYRGECCNYSLRACDEDNKICIKRYMWCNGIVDCESGIDETDCNRDNCLPDQYKCDNGKCLPLELTCNFRNDCGDNSDELDGAKCPIIPCHYGEFQCEETRQCLPLYALCNDRLDCEDGSDEPGGPGGLFCSLYKVGLCDYDVTTGRSCVLPSVHYSDCPGGFRFMHCGGNETKICLPERNTCDGKVDCQYGEDEAECQNYYFKCPYGTIKCDSGQCIPDDRLCDGITHCADGIDETNCQGGLYQNQTWSCSEGDHQYIHAVLRCNGYPNCEHKEDELGCDHYQCPVGMMKCKRSHLCVDNSKICDGSYDCAYTSVFDLTDEENCEENATVCPPWKHQCDNGQCIDKNKRCDFFPNCLDKSDERNCTKEDCLQGTSLCTSFLSGDYNPTFFCLGDIHWCDGIDDCFYGEDKSICENYTCLESQFRCGLDCKPIEERCDSVVNCPAHQDEVNCENYKCPGGYFRCRSGQCIRHHLYCDELTRPDCGDGSDEIFCNATCDEDQLQCASGWCVNLSLVCDGVDDCGDGTDELNCKLCNSSQYTCRSGFEEGKRIVVKCIPAERKCDRFVDCHFSDDEYNCEYAVRDVTSERGWNTRYLEISDDVTVYEDFRETFFVNRATDFIPKQYPPSWGHFLVSSNTPDFSDLNQVLKLSQGELRSMGHQGQDLIVQCTYDQRNVV